jgi:hypothetical protein
MDQPEPFLTLHTHPMAGHRPIVTRACAAIVLWRRRLARMAGRAML